MARLPSTADPPAGSLVLPRQAPDSAPSQDLKLGTRRVRAGSDGNMKPIRAHQGRTIAGE